MQDIKINDQTPHFSKHVLPLVVGGLTITCEDNMELMSRYPDKYFDLAIVDPPYGIGHSLLSGEKRGSKFVRTTKHVEWDVLPNEKYFKELFRVSQNQIIWGGNYFLDYLPSTRGMLIWDKIQIFSGADFEFAWISFDTSAKAFRMSRVEAYGNMNKIHPTEKPIDLYKFCLEKYAKQGDKILDTHLGSGSIAIACHDYKFELTACELDPEYFEKAKQRIINHTNQQNLEL
jgi:site-specific DNA-methyltransferase (adenine-specific)